MNIDFANGLAIGLCCKASRFSMPGAEPATYLYGTPSESGNIGLRVGDTVTMYEGYIAPKLPDFSGLKGAQYGYTYDYIIGHRYVNLHGTVFNHLVAFTKAPATDTVSSGERILQENGYGAMFSVKDETYDKWEVHTDKMVSSASKMAVYFEEILWSSFNIFHTDGSPFMMESKPIPVGSIVDHDGDIPIYEVI